MTQSCADGKQGKRLTSSCLLFPVGTQSISTFPAAGSLWHVEDALLNRKMWTMEDALLNRHVWTMVGRDCP